MSDPIPAVRSKPGEYFLAAEKIAVGDRFQSRDAIYEITELTPIGGGGFMATIHMTEGRAAGKNFHAMLRTGRQVKGGDNG